VCSSGGSSGRGASSGEGKTRQKKETMGFLVISGIEDWGDQRTGEIKIPRDSSVPQWCQVRKIIFGGGAISEEKAAFQDRLMKTSRDVNKKKNGRDVFSSRYRTERSQKVRRERPRK